MADRKNLKETLKNGHYKVYTILRHVSRSGMFRVIDCITIVNNDVYAIGASVADILGMKWDYQRHGIKISGCGEDEGYKIVYDLSCELYRGDKYDHDKAYKLQHNWL